MKKTARIIATILVLVLLSITLCSCTALDEMKDRHGVYLDEEKTEITFRGMTYKLMEKTDNYIMGHNEDYYENGYVTTPDVPVLLSSSEGDYMSFTYKRGHRGEEAPLYIDVDTKRSYDSTVAYLSDTYIREDKYDELAEKLKGEDLDYYYIDYFDHEAYEEHFNHYDNGYAYYDDEDFYNKCYVKEIINDKYADIIDKVLDNKDIMMHDELPLGIFKQISLFKCDETMTVSKYGYMLSLYEHDGEYLISQDELYYLHKVSKEDAKVLKELFDKYSGAVELFKFNGGTDIEYGV